MKQLNASFVCLALFFLSFTSSAQLKFPVSNNGLRNDLQKVLADLPNQFSSLKGDIIIENPQSIEYASLIKFSGAEDNTITQYIANKPIYSWQATMITTEDYDEAVKKYKWLTGQLKGMTIRLQNDYTLNLNGPMENPNEGKKFCSTNYRLIPNASNLPKLKVEVSMQFYFPEWKVNLTVYQKEREDNERGPIEEEK
ncbi:MAG TPA: hypothetical protein VHK91_02635 [Flavisolibacter sp.]|jgi:hypothetical protein|nr:hypothetical protein [Flavisolibacter sp.]